MNPLLPAYDPPNAQRAAIAIAVAPILVLLSFTLIVCGLIEVATGFAVFAAGTAWVVVEMHLYHNTIDGYDEEYVGQFVAPPTPQREGQLKLKPLTCGGYLRLLSRDGGGV